MVRALQGKVGTVAMTLRSGLPTITLTKNRIESYSFLMHFAMNPICFAALEGSFARKIRISYTLKMESYTQSFTRNCKQIQEVSVSGVGNVGYFPKTFFVGGRKSTRTGKQGVFHEHSKTSVLLR